MRLYTFYTPSHEIFKDQWFLPTLKDDYELRIIRCDQGCPSGEFQSNGWTKTMLWKSNLILQAVQENWGQVFIYSDIDVQFFRSVKSTIVKLIRGQDIIFLRDSPQGTLCAGFFACRANQKTLRLWEDIREILLKELNQDQGDQAILNRLLRDGAGGIFGLIQHLGSRLIKFLGQNDSWVINHLSYFGNPYRIKWSYFPLEFFGGGALTGQHWQPSMPLTIPQNIAIHHANWTVGTENKIAQLRMVREAVNSRLQDLNSRKVNR